MRVCIHIGAPKTGSSAIQNFLRNNRSKLEKCGYFYPEHRTDKNDVSGGHSELGRAVIDGNLHAASAIADQWLEEARARKLTLLVSAEALYGRVEETRKVFSGQDVQILAYFRNPIESLVSNHNQSIKRHYGRFLLAEFLERRAHPDNRGVNGEVFLDWIAAFGRKAVKVRPYDPKAFKGERIEYDFLDMLAVQNYTARSFRLEKRLINTSYTPGALELKRLLNFVLDTQAPKVGAEIDWALQQYSDRTNVKISAAEKEPIPVDSGVLNDLVESFRPALEKMSAEVLENCPTGFWQPVTVVGVEAGEASLELREVIQAYDYLQGSIPKTMLWVKGSVVSLIDGKPPSELPFAVHKLATVMGVPFREPNPKTVKPMVVDRAVNAVLSDRAQNADYLRELAILLAAQDFLPEAVKVIEKARSLRPNGLGIIKLHESYLNQLSLTKRQDSVG